MSDDKGGRGIHITGSANGSLLNTGDDSINILGSGNQVNTGQQGADLQQLLALIEQLRQGLPKAGLDEFDEKAVSQSLELAREAATAEKPSGSAVKRALDSVHQTLKSVVGTGDMVRKMIPWAAQAGILAAQIFGG